MKKIRSLGIALLQPLLMMTVSTLAHAVGGTGLPWDEPLTTVSDALWGTPAHAIMTAVIVFAGLAWA